MALPLSAATRRRAAIASVLLAMAAAVLDASSINIALPSLAAAVRVEPSIAAWLIIAYQGALVAGLLPLAAVGDRFGHRLIFNIGIALFALSALACGFAPTFGLLVAARIFQGIGAAAIMALGVALLRQIVDADKLGRAIGWNAMTVALMSAAGPTIGAALLGLGSWRFIFIGGLILAAASLAAGRSLPRAGVARRDLDGVGLSLYIMIVPTFVVAAAIARASVFGSVMLLSAGLAGLFGLVRRDRRRQPSFLPLDLFRSSPFGRSVLSSVFCFAGLSSALLMLPFALHNRLGSSVQSTAMMMTAWPLAVLSTTPVTARLLDEVQPSRLCAAGGIILSCGLLLLAAGSAAGVAVHLIGITLCGIGFGLFQTPNNRTMLLAAPASRAASAGGVQGTARLTGQVTGALAASVLMSAMPVEASAPAVFGVAAVATFCAAAINGMTRTSRG